MKNVIIGFLCGFLLSFTITCMKTDDSDLQAQPTTQAVSAIIEPNAGVASTSPCDTVYYKPVAYGVPLFPVKNTLSSGVRKGVSYWSTKIAGNNLIPYMNYQQNPVSERIVILDTTKIVLEDTFWVCRKIRI